MKIKLLEGRLIGDKNCAAGDEVEVADEGYAKYLIETGAAEAPGKPGPAKKANIDKLDEAIEKNDPNIIRHNEPDMDEPLKKGKR